MYFYDFNKIVGEAVSHSSVSGQPVNGAHLQMSLLRFEAGGGAKEHSHAYEQMMFVLSGKLKVRVDNVVEIVEAGQLFLAPPSMKHAVTALEKSEVISCKNIT